MSNNDINESNIFKELSGDLDFGDIKQDIAKIETVKDSIYYMKIASKGMFYLNIVSVIIVSLLYSYISIEKSESMLNSTLLNPFCSILLGGDLSSKISGDCSSIYSLYTNYLSLNDNLKNTYTKTISDILPGVYAIENFSLSKDVKFLVEKTDNRLKPLDIISDFDKLKNSFVAGDKAQIKCFNTEIDKDSNFSMSCTAYSSDWDDSIPSSEPGRKISGTSISLAASFISYIEKNGKSFEVVDKPKNFSSEVYSGVGYYTKKTDFNLKLKYYKNNINNF